MSTTKTLDRRGPMPRRAVVLLGLVVIGCLGGCEIWGFMASGFDTKTVSPRYDLADRPTLVLVDDPGGRLQLAEAPAVIASRIGFDLQQAGVVSHVVSQQAAVDLAGQLGDQFARTPVDAVGRALGAAQVIYVYVDDAALIREPGVLRPRAQVRVKVIDAQASRRLFPSGDDSAAGLDRGYLVAAELPARTQLDERRVQLPATLRDLADRTGIEVARLFYKHRKEQIPYDRPGPAQ